MRTAIIFNIVPEEIKYFIVDGDRIDLLGVYINSTAGDTEEQQQSLNDLIYDCEGQYRLPSVGLIEFAEAIRQGAEIVECGFIL